MKIYTADTLGVPTNRAYPHAHEVFSAEELRRAVNRDYVCAEYAEGLRSSEGFLRADCLPMDCDNDHSDREEDWIRPEEVARMFPGVNMGIHYSRNHMRPKGDRSPRPRFHILFAIRPCTDAGKYRAMKEAVHTLCPFFDGNALDAARFMFGTAEPETEWIPGERTLDDALKERAAEELLGQAPETGEKIPRGRRNRTLSVYAARLLKRLGNTEETLEKFLERAGDCVPPLPEGELRSIWHSACRFYAKISRLESYIPPEQYRESGSLRPKLLTDLAEAHILADEYADRLRYSAATQYMVYQDGVWKESNEGAVGVMCELVERQLEEHEPALSGMKKKKEETAIAARNSDAAVGTMADLRARKTELKHMMEVAREEWQQEEGYQKFLMSLCTFNRVNSILNLAKPMLMIDVSELDANPFLLNTPAGEVDLRTGEMTPHNPRHYHTRMTAVSPSEENMEEWLAHVNEVTCGDTELARYFQITSGEELLGTVRNECLRIEIGSGANGKSTYTNTKLRVLGTYGGQLSAESLTLQSKYSKNWEIGDLRGKRLIVAGELEEGQRLNDAFVKKICSTDPIIGEKKHKDPFTFLPSHSVVLYTNHLPKVASRDRGIWRRLKVIPFNAMLSGTGKYRNYTEYLTEHCGGAVLKWMIDGAREFIAGDFEIEDPPCVRNAIEEYRRDNDWLAPFLAEYCEADPDAETPAGALYTLYRDFCFRRGNRPKGAPEFTHAMEANGYRSERNRKGCYYQGLRVNRDTRETFGGFPS